MGRRFVSDTLKKGISKVASEGKKLFNAENLAEAKALMNELAEKAPYSDEAKQATLNFQRLLAQSERHEAQLAAAAAARKAASEAPAAAPGAKKILPALMAAPLVGAAAASAPEANAAVPLGERDPAFLKRMEAMEGGGLQAPAVDPLDLIGGGAVGKVGAVGLGLANEALASPKDDSAAKAKLEALQSIAERPIKRKEEEDEEQF